MVVRGVLIVAVLGCSVAYAQEFREQYSAKAGFYAPAKGLNNGFILGADASLDFPDYRFAVQFSGECYIKKTLGLFKDSNLDVVQQQILLVPVAVGMLYRLGNSANEGVLVSLGAGVGYYFDFYNIDYRENLIPVPGTRSDSKTGGNFYSAVMVRACVNNFFIEPKMLFAKSHGNVIGSSSYEINPSGFILTVGFQY